jgi:uncharacterized protein YndB with AHSA1/START domain
MTSKAGNKTILTTPTDREIVMTREFDAPRELVFKVMTDPELIPRWWGPARYPTRVDTMDVRPGGKWRFVSTGSDGEEFAFRGEYREITPPERIVQTFEFEPFPGHVSIETGVLEEKDGKTVFTTTSLFDSKEDRDGMLSSGMEGGAVETHDRLEQLLKEFS